MRELREARILADIAVFLTLVLYVTLPGELTFGPPWLVPLIGVGLLVSLTLVGPHRRSHDPFWQRTMPIILIGLINAANVVSLVLLLYSLVSSSKNTAALLILESIKIWITNVVIFALWYWEFDSGGPAVRYRLIPQKPGAKARTPDFLFPQMTLPDASSNGWIPTFVDYLYLGFTNATAFSPTDTLPLTPWAKMLMMVQAMISLLTIAFVVSRAINILPG